MKLLNDNKGYITGILIMVMIIPIMFLLITIIEQENHYINKTVENIQDNKLTIVTNDFQREIPLLTRKSMNNLTLSVIINRKPLVNATEELITDINYKLKEKEVFYEKNMGCIISCNVTDIKTSKTNPFQLEVSYKIDSKFREDSNISQGKKIYVELVDDEYPVYDPFAILKADTALSNDIVYYNQITQLENSGVYDNAISGCVIKPCPYTNYEEHGNNNTTILNCINNHYYHESHDGLCIFCRLENKTSCLDYGIETFVIPTKNEEKAPVSIDHVLLNDTEGQYMGQVHILDNNTILYLDNDHKNKYGL